MDPTIRPSPDDTDECFRLDEEPPDTDRADAFAGLMVEDDDGEYG